MGGDLEYPLPGDIYFILSVLIKNTEGRNSRHTEGRNIDIHLISSKEVATTSGLIVHRYETQLKIVK